MKHKYVSKSCITLFAKKSNGFWIFFLGKISVCSPFPYGSDFNNPCRLTFVTFGDLKEFSERKHYDV